MSSPIETELTAKEAALLRQLRSALLQSGKMPSVRHLQSQMGYRSPRSVSVLIDTLCDKGFLSRNTDGKLTLLQETPREKNHATTVDVPLVGNVSCGTPLLAESHVDAFIPVSTAIAKPPHRYFLLRARGDSMNRAGIDDGDLVLIRQSPTAHSGDRVVALIDSDATIKILRPGPKHIILEPHSDNPAHQPIILEHDFQVQGVVVEVIRLKTN